MELRKKPSRNVEVGPIHIIGEFIDDASQQFAPDFPDAKKSQGPKKRRTKNKREKR
jgi:hypothetical protein